RDRRAHFPGSDSGPVRPCRDGARGSGRRQERCGEAGEQPREPGQAHHSERDCGETAGHRDGHGEQAADRPQADGRWPGRRSTGDAAGDGQPRIWRQHLWKRKGWRLRLARSATVDPPGCGSDPGLTPNTRMRVELQLAGDEEVRTVVPYGAVYYDAQGATWVYVNTAPRTFERQKIGIERVIGDLAVLSEGPPVKTAVVTVGAALLYGAEV